jgi:hypothetical protein
MNNFKCLNCDYIFFVNNYSFSIVSSKTIYKFMTGKQIECPKCKSNEIEYIEKEGDFNVELGKYSMQSIPQRQESLKKRSHAHFKKEIEHKKKTIDGSATLQINE